jgi:hypothetical protein
MLILKIMVKFQNIYIGLFLLQCINVSLLLWNIIL